MDSWFDGVIGMYASNYPLPDWNKEVEEPDLQIGYIELVFMKKPISATIIIPISKTLHHESSTRKVLILSSSIIFYLPE